MPSFNSQGKDLRGFGIVLFLGLLALNASLVSPHIGWYDTGEMIGATACLGISHPSGQVLFHLLGKIFLLLPLQTPAFRIGFFSATCSALASALFWLLACRLAAAISGKPTSGILKTWLFLLTLAWSLSLPWWRYSLMPLVYALHLLLGMLVLWALGTERPRRWALVLFLLGISTVFRPTQFFALPFVGVAYLFSLRKDWKDGKDLEVKGLLLTLLGFLVGRSTALYLPLRSALHPAIAYGDLTHPVSLFHHVFALKFSGFVGKMTASTVSPVFHQMASHFWSDLTPLGSALTVGGLWVLLKDWKKIPLFLGVALGWGLLEALFVFTIPYPTFESHQVLLGWVYSGFLAALLLARWGPSLERNRLWRALTGFALLSFVGLQAMGFGHLADRKQDRGAEDFARNLLEIMEPKAVYYPAEENEYFPVAGYQQSMGFRQDVSLLEPGASPTVVGEKIRECLGQGRALYVTRKWVLPPGWTYAGLGPLLKVVPLTPGENLPRVPPGSPVEALWGGVALLEAKIIPAQVKAGGLVEIDYRWERRGASPCDDTSTVVALFTDKEGNFLTRNGSFWLHDIREGPMGKPTDMTPGRIYAEKRILFIPSDFPPGNYRLVLGLQKPPAGRHEGQESFGKEFYERAGNQTLDKFTGHAETDAVVQFAPAVAGALGNGLWPVTKCAQPSPDSHFAVVGDLQIQ